MNCPYKVGDKYPTWFSDEPDGLSTILKVAPYRGGYPQYFKYDLTLTAPRTHAREVVMSVE